jgi:hypothetical protein
VKERKAPALRRHQDGVQIAVAFIDIMESEEVVEGHFWAPSANGIRYAPSNVRCPFCFGAMELVTGKYFGRIMAEVEGKRTKQTAQASVEFMPETHEALSCTGCEIVLTRPKEHE